jgi:hypothetical protein
MPRRPYVAHPPALASTIKERTESPILRPPGVIVEDDIELGASRLRRRRLAARRGRWGYGEASVSIARSTTAGPLTTRGRPSGSK